MRPDQTTAGSVVYLQRRIRMEEGVLEGLLLVQLELEFEV